MHIFMVITAGTRTVMVESAGMKVTGATDRHIVTVEKTTCKEFCMNDSQCVTAMHDGTKCFVYYNEVTEEAHATYTVYKKGEKTSTGVLTCDVTLCCLIFCLLSIILWSNMGRLHHKCY